MGLRSDIESRSRRIAKCRNGNVTILLSLGLFVVIGSAGAAIDFLRLTSEETIMSAAADAAALAAVAAATDATLAGRSSPGQIGETAALKAWHANAANSTVPDPPRPAVALARDGTSWSATVSYDVTASTTFMSVLGIKTMQVKGEARASNALPGEGGYWDFHVVADTSSSMALAATPATMARMKSSFGCEFACHSTTMDFSGKTTATPAAAKAAGMKLRIDVVDDAVDGLVDEIARWHGAKGIRAALWGLNNTVDQLVPITGRLGDVAAHDLQIARELGSVGQTDLETSLKTLASLLPVSGNGSTAASPREAVFLITDGLHDARTPTAAYVSQWNGPHYLGPINVEACQALKDRGILVGVLYIDYYTPQGYESVTAPVIDDLKPRLAACASDNLFFNATGAADIEQALKDMFGAVVASRTSGKLRLTN